MCPETFNHLCNELGSAMRRQDTQFRRAVPLPEHIAVTLWRLANNVEYRTISQLFGIGRSIACQIVQDVSREIVRILMPKYIQIPEGQYLNEVIEGFQRKHQFPQIGGAIDACHIPIVVPQVHLTDYHNRKGFNPVLLQAIVDHKYCFMDVCIGWLGRVHDACILHNSFFEYSHSGGGPLEMPTEAPR